METKILIPVDGSDTTARTLEKIIALKDRFPKELTLLHVVDVDKLAYRMIPDFQIEMVRDNAGEFGLPRQSICKIANDEAFELMIIGRRESTGEIRDVLFGSVANYVLHNVACPVLLF
jgi:nucleotide-binding universal stress UspA family protein